MKNPFLNLSIWTLFSLFFFFFSFKLSHQASPPFPYNLRLLNAYTALQAWKHEILSYPYNLTSSWQGPNVCLYSGVKCGRAPDDPDVVTVTGIDLRHGNITGTLSEKLVLLTDLTHFFIRSNRFSSVFQ